MVKHWLTPSFADFVFAALFAWLVLSSPDSLSLLLKDSDTGWHIRTSHWILDHRQFLYTDPFSFTRPGHLWFAWEWGTGVIFAGFHQLGGLAMVSLASGLLILAAMLVLLRWMIWRGSSILVAFPLLLLAVSGSSLHFLARPHIFSILFFVIPLWLFDYDRRHPSPRIWLLVPLTLLWVNIHGAWPILLVLGGTHLAASVLYRDGSALRLLRVLTACSAISFVNPYGWHLHQHLFLNVSWKWVVEFIDEYQSPKFRSEGLFHFELLLLSGVATAFARAPLPRRPCRSSHRLALSAYGSQLGSAYSFVSRSRYTRCCF